MIERIADAMNIAIDLAGIAGFCALIYFGAAFVSGNI
jgi:hypothetical protein